MVSKLLILGNGFDLRSGLHSRYADFFEDQLKNNAEFKKYYDEVKAGGTVQFMAERDLADGRFFTKDLTAWDMLFIVRNISDGDWCDIEKAIEESLQSGWLETAVIASKTTQLSSKYNPRDLATLAADRFVGNIELKELRKVENGLGWEPSEITKRFTENIFYPFLLRQLELFENRFRQYLIGEVKKIESAYSTKAWKLLLELLGINFDMTILSPNQMPTLPKMNILCFNYTNPFLINGSIIGSYMNITRKPPKCSNVHGTLADGFSIFGIDSVYRTDDKDTAKPEWISIDDPKYVFTKTYRKIDKMANGTPYSSIADESTEHIIFYGHSLNEQDYSYFHTLFDMLDLYGSRIKDSKKERVKLTFYYSDDHAIGEEKKEAVRIRYVKAITALLSKYGETFDNRAHGKNLIDKLLNEGRLEIKKL